MKKREQTEVLRELLDKSGWSQRGAARQLQIAERTMRNYVSGDTPIPRAIMMALEAVTGQHGFYQTLAAQVREEAGCSCGEFEIDTYGGVGPGSRVLAGLSIGNCAACTEGRTEDRARAVLGTNRIPVIDSWANRRGCR